MNSKYAKLFEPTKLGKLTIKNKIAMSPMQPRFIEGTHEDATFTKWYAEYFKERAKGGVGLILTGQIKAEKDIDPYPLNSCFPVIDCEERVKEFTEVTETVHRYGAKIAAQLSAGAGRLADLPQNDKWPAAPSIQPMFYRPDLLTRELTVGEIGQLVDSYGKAADRVKRAGFDALYIHADAYLIDQFISSCWNKRTDEYGGNLENRMRFLKECLESARKYVGDDFPIIVGLALDHGFEGGREIEETLAIAKEVEKLGIDVFHMRNGSYDGMNMLSPNAHYPDGMVIKNAEIFRKEIKTPMIIDGKFGDPDLCLEVIENGTTDVVGMARAWLGEPEWANKVRKGNVEDIRPCIRCMECFDRILKGKYMGCTVNARVGHERELSIMPAFDKKNVLIVGAGPAGMEAARVAGSRGHNVTLVDKNEELGGRLVEAAAPDYKYLIGNLNSWLQRQINKYNIKVELGIEVDEKYIEELKPDAVIIAAGAEPFIPRVKGVEKSLHGVDVLNNKVKTGDKVVVVGGGLVGSETAYYLAKQGKKVEIVEMRPELVMDVSMFNRYEMMGELQQLAVVNHLNSKLSEVKDNGAVVIDKEGNEKFIEADNVVMAAGFVGSDSLYMKFQSLVDEVYQIGDVTRARKIYDAIHDGYEIAKEI